jgi:hypothetical protein
MKNLIYSCLMLQVILISNLACPAEETLRKGGRIILISLKLVSGGASEDSPVVKSVRAAATSLLTGEAPEVAAFRVCCHDNWCKLIRLSRNFYADYAQKSKFMQPVAIILGLTGTVLSLCLGRPAHIVSSWMAASLIHPVLTGALAAKPQIDSVKSLYRGVAEMASMEENLARADMMYPQQASDILRKEKGEAVKNEVPAREIEDSFWRQGPQFRNTVKDRCRANFWRFIDDHL